MPAHSEGSGERSRRQWAPCRSLAALRRAVAKNKEARAFCSALPGGHMEGVSLKNLERPPSEEKQVGSESQGCGRGFRLDHS